MMTTLFSEWDEQPVSVAPKALIEVKPVPKYDNPCMTLYGKGPQGAQCKDCTHLLRLMYHDKTYRKCRFRPLTHGPGSDHKATWYACGKFNEAESEAHA